MTIRLDSKLSFISSLYQAPQAHLKQLSQKERLFCMSCLKSMSDETSPFDKELAQKVINTVQTVPSRGRARKLFSFIISLIKGVLNWLKLRCSSQQLCDRLDFRRKAFLARSTGSQIALLEVGNPQTAEILFFGDSNHCHESNLEILVASGLKYWKNGDYLLSEGLESMTRSGACLGWDNEEAFNKGVDLQILSNALDVHEYLKEKDKQMAIRNQSLIKTVKTLQEKIKREKSNRKILVFAGSNHLICPGHYILNHFDPNKCYLMVKRDEEKSTQEDLKRYLEKLKKGRTNFPVSSSLGKQQN